MQNTDHGASVHANAIVEEGARVGARTRVWAFAHILPGAVIGEDCNICDHTFIENAVRLGNRVTVKNGVNIWDGLEIHDDVFIGPCAVFTNDLYPRSRRPSVVSKTVLRRGCSVGANATILAGNTVGSYAMVGAASTVTQDVPDYALVVGSPARFTHWICECATRLKLAEGEILPCECGKRYQIEDKHRIKRCG